MGKQQRVIGALHISTESQRKNFPLNSLVQENGRNGQQRG